MPSVRLPDGQVLEVAPGSSVADVARQIGPGLAKAAVAARLGGEPVDLATVISENGEAELEILTEKSDAALDILRHSTAHVMAQAVGRLHPGVKFGIGPSIENGFYYDFDLPEPLTEDDLPRIENEMRRIVDEAIPFEREEVSLEEARRRMQEKGQPYKVELLDDLAEPSDGSAPPEAVSLYGNGDFVDLCRGPHVPDTGRLKAFKLTGVAGAYWHGDETRPMLQRVYGTAFWDTKALEEHLARLEEAKQRDHRRLGTELDLFSFHEEGPGFAFFHPKGCVVWNELVGFWRRTHERHGYSEIRTPVILSESLWHRSGHWDHYHDNMYFTSIDDRPFAIKPMNCPGGLLVYKSRPHSYKELPIKNAELGLVHRHEKSGVMHGLMRVRQFTQDDAHVFCLPEQTAEEVAKVIDLVQELYAPFHFDEVVVELSTRPHQHTIGSDEMWRMATVALREALDSRGLTYQVNEGEGAFYGPKIDFHVRDCLGRTWQCGTIQADFAMPERFDIAYVGADNSEHRPVMIHRAIFGSLERFFGIVTEHFGGAFPLWLGPLHAVVLPVSEKFSEYAEEVRGRLKAAGLRVEADLRSDKVGAKIRDATLQKVPYMLIVGGREADGGTVSVRERTAGDVGAISVDAFARAALQEIDSFGQTRVLEQVS